MKILAIGDVVGSIGCKFLRQKLNDYRQQNKIDLVIANGENSADGNGITPFSANFLFESGVDIITTGNHAFRRREIYPYFESHAKLIRPVNYPHEDTPGNGVYAFDLLNAKVCIINLMGTLFIDNFDCPFKTMDKLLQKYSNHVIIIDFHAEATSEKRALGFYLDGKVSAIFGTHTHVQTADEMILPKGTAYITDLGMTGTVYSCIGVDPKIVIEKFLKKMPVRFKNNEGKCRLDGAVFCIDEVTKKANLIKRVGII